MLWSFVFNYIYDAAGTKLKKTAGSSVTEYAGNYVYSGNTTSTTLQFFNQPEGYVTPSAVEGSYNYVYQYKDHLGNIRLSFSDGNGDGDIDVTNDPLTTEIVEENNYYPFGLKHKGYNEMNSTLGNSVANRWKYNGKEIDEDLGLNLYHYGFRLYDPAIGRFPSMDPISDQFPHVSTYNYAENEPVGSIDLWGLQKVRVYNGVQYVEFNQASISPTTRANGQKFTATALSKDRVGVSDFTINLQQYEAASAGAYLSVLSPGDNSNWTAQGQTVQDGSVVIGRSSPDTFNMSQSATTCEWSCSMGDPPADSKIGIGGGVPVIVDGLPYGETNKYSSEAPGGLPLIGDPGAGNRKFLTQRSNAGYPKQNNAKVGKSIVAFNSKTGKFMIIVQEDGVSGMSLDEIRNNLISLGYNNALSFDGSNSATLVQDDNVIVQPSSKKDNTIPSGATFNQQ